jgi:hypothetical protein
VRTPNRKNFITVNAMQNILARIQFKIMKLTKIVVGYYILSILSGLCSILSINLSLLQKSWVEIEKRRRILTFLLLDTKKRKGKKKID